MKSTTSVRHALYCVLGLLMLVPLASLVMNFGINTYFPYIVPGAIAFRVLTLIAFSLWVILAVRDPRYRLPMTTIAWSFTAFIVIVGIADAVGVDPIRSFWSNFERMEGFVSWIHLYLLFIVFAGALRSMQAWSALAGITWGVAVLNALFGLLIEDGVDDGRASGIIGNAIYLAIYMLLACFLVLYVMVRRASAGIRETGWVYAGYAASLILFISTIVVTGTRGTMVAGAASILVFAAGVAFSERRLAPLRKGAIALVALVAVMVAALFFARDTAFVTQNRTLERAASVFDLGHTTVTARFENWGIAWESFKQRPILGWGQENYLYAFAYNFNPEMFDQEPWFDRTHNVIMDWLIAGGVLGLLAYLALFGFAVLEALRSRALSAPERWAIVGALVAYFVHNLFVFDYLVSAMFYVIILAYINRATAKAQVVSKAPGVSREDLSDGLLYGLTAAVTVLVLYFVNVPGMRANAALIDALSTTNPDVQMEAYQRAIAASPLGRSEAVEQFVQGSMNVKRSQVPEEYKMRYGVAAGEAIEAENAAHPDNVRTLTFLGAYLVAWGRVDEGVAAFERAAELAPNRQTNLLQLVTAYRTAGRDDEALVTARTAYELQTDNVAARLAYAAALTYAGINTEADALLEGLNPATTRDFVQTMLPAYEASKQYARMVALLEPIAEMEPANVGVNVRLAATYLLLNRRTDAIATLQALSDSIQDPTATSEIDALIAAIKAGRNPLIDLQ